MTDPIVIAFAAVVYTLIAVRVGLVVNRARRQHGLDASHFFCVFHAALWPVTVYMLGFLLAISGDAGIFTKALPSEERQGAASPMSSKDGR